MARFQTTLPADEVNIEALMALPGRWVDHVNCRSPARKLVLDMDSSESPVHGKQEGSEYNGHFGCDWYHPSMRESQGWMKTVIDTACRQATIHIERRAVAVTAGIWGIPVHVFAAEVEGRKVPKSEPRIAVAKNTPKKEPEPAAPYRVWNRTVRMAYCRS